MDVGPDLRRRRPSPTTRRCSASADGRRNTCATTRARSPSSASSTARQWIFAICHGVQLVAAAGLLTGKNMTCYEHVRLEAEAAGGRYVERRSRARRPARLVADLAGASGVLSRNLRVPAGTGAGVVRLGIGLGLHVTSSPFRPPLTSSRASSPVSGTVTPHDEPSQSFAIAARSRLPGQAHRRSRLHVALQRQGLHRLEAEQPGVLDASRTAPSKRTAPPATRSTTAR